MDEASSTELPNKSSKASKVITAILAIGAVGSTAAVYIPAIAGQSPDPLSLIYLIFWFSFLFARVWVDRKKNWIVGLIFGAVVGVAVYYAASFPAAYSGAEPKAIDAAIQRLNKEFGLPMMIDEDTRFDSISISQNLKNLNINTTFVNHSLSELDIDVLDTFFKENQIRVTCANKKLKSFLDDGYAITYVYYDKTSKFVTKFKLLAIDC